MQNSVESSCQALTSQPLTSSSDTGRDAYLSPCSEHSRHIIHPLQLPMDSGTVQFEVSIQLSCCKQEEMCTTVGQRSGAP